MIAGGEKYSLPGRWWPRAGPACGAGVPVPTDVLDRTTLASPWLARAITTCASRATELLLDPILSLPSFSFLGLIGSIRLSFSASVGYNIDPA